MKVNFSHPTLSAILPLPCLRGAYLVGGAVRDIASGKKPVDRQREISDIDLAVPGSAEAVCREVAEALGGTAFVLDRDRDVWRVSLPEGGHVDIVTLSPGPYKPLPPRPPLPPAGEEGDNLNLSPRRERAWGGEAILADLSARDFTIDAMALSLDDLRRRKKSRSSFDIVDPFGGLKDMQRRLVRALSKKALSDDPLRMLRAFRLANQLGFKIEENTLRYIRELTVFIDKTSQERIRDEIYVMLETPDSWRAFRAMADAGILENILPETKKMRALPQGEAHKYDLLGHSLKAMEYAESVMRDARKHFGVWSPQVSSYLMQRIDGNLTAMGLIKLAALLHDSGKPPTMFIDTGRIRFTGHDIKGAEINEMAAERLKMSSKAKELLSLTARHHMRPLHMSKQRITGHAIYRYCRDIGPHLPASLIIALADAFATREKPESIATDIEGVAAGIAEYYYGEFLREEERPLLRGRDLIEELNLPPGPMFSRFLEDIREKRAEGIIKTRDEALEYVKNLSRK